MRRLLAVAFRSPMDHPLRAWPRIFAARMALIVLGGIVGLAWAVFVLLLHVALWKIVQ